MSLHLRMYLAWVVMVSYIQTISNDMVLHNVMFC